MRVLVTGSRDWDDVHRFLQVMHTHVESQWPKGYDSQGHFVDYMPPSDFVLLHGGCPTGADALADNWAVSHQVDVEVYPADWNKHGRAAGPIRNQQMVDSGPDLCLAFIKNDSRGASGTAAMAERAGIKTIRVVDPSPDA